MWRKFLTIILVLVLGLHPVAQAVGPLVAPAEHPAHAHESMTVDCDQVDLEFCIDLDSCCAGGHAKCDAGLKIWLSVSRSAEHPRGQVYASDRPERYRSQHAERLLRPPRSA